MTDVFHVSGFIRDGRPSGLHVAVHRDAQVHEIAKGVLETAASHEGTTIRSLWMTRSIGGGWPTEVEAVTVTDIGDGDERPMWHVFTTESDAWPTSPRGREEQQHG